MFAYTWNCTTNAEPQSMEFYFSYAPRSDCVAHFPAVAALFLRGDVKRHRRRIDVNLPKEVFADRLRNVGRPARLQGVASASGRTLDETLVLVHGVGVDVDATTPAVEDASWEKTAGSDRYASDTGELVWTAGAPGTRHFTADTAGTKFLSGFAKGRRVDFSDGVSFAVGATSRGWAAVSLVSHDDTGFGADGRAVRLLLTATAGGANTGLVTEPVPGKEGRRRLGLKGEWGTAPYLVEGVPVAVTLKADPARVRCWALDPAGARKRAVSVMAAPGGNSLVRVDPSFQTLWYEIEVGESAAEAKRRHVLAQTEARLWKDASGVLPYRFHAPAVQKPGQRYPLVVLMHGAGSRGTDNVRQVNNGGRDLFDWARRTGRDFFFLAPQCPEGRQWVDGPWGALTHRMAERPNPQMAAAMALVEDTVRREAVDPARVYVMGISMGGYATWELLQRRPDLFSGALPCCGGGDVTLAERLKDVPVWAFHGDDDGVVPVSRTREMIAALRKFGAPALYREYPGVNHDCWTRTYADDTVFYWLFSNRKKGMKPSALTGVVVPHPAVPRVTGAWNGKKVAFLGDSITDPVHVGCTANYWNYLPDILGIDAFVYGKNGWRMGDIPIQAEALAAELGDAVDAIFVLAGTNDYNAGVPLGEWFDETVETVLRSKGPAKAKHRRFSMDKNTFRGRINRLVSCLKKTFPRQQIVLMTALHRGYATFGPNNVQPDESYSNTLGLFIDDYNDDIRAAGRLWSVPVLDLFERSGLFPNEPAHTRYFSKEDTDRLHPSSEGHRRIAETMAAWMQTIPPDFKFSK